MRVREESDRVRAMIMAPKQAPQLEKPRASVKSAMHCKQYPVLPKMHKNN